MKKIAAAISCSLSLLLGSIFTTAPTAFASTSTSFNSYAVAYNAQIIMHPTGFVRNNTTYMTVQDVVHILQTMNIKSSWANGNLVIGNPIPVDTPRTPLKDKCRIYLQGNLFRTVPLVQIARQSNEQSMTYIPIWYVMQALKQIGQNNNWNGHQWTMGHPVE